MFWVALLEEPPVRPQEPSRAKGGNVKPVLPLGKRAGRID